MSRWRLRERVRRAVAGEPAGSLDPDVPDLDDVPVGPRDPAEVDADVLRHARTKGVSVQCVDLRPPELLRYGVVRGAWLLDPARLRRLTPWLADRPHVVLGPHDGLDDLLPPHGPLAGRTRGGLQAWRQAGFKISAPEWKAPLPLLHPVALAADALHSGRFDGLDAATLSQLTSQGTAGPPGGTIQDIRWHGGEFVYDVLLDLADGRPLWVPELVEEQLQSIGPRGAAGLGAQIG